MSSIPIAQMIESVVVYANVAAYAACYMAQIPVLPFLIHHIGAEASAYGVLQTVFSAVQAIGGLVSGVLMDQYGAKVVLLASFAASAATYGLTASAQDISLLYASSVPTLFQHAVLAVRVWVSNASSPELRAAMLGYIGLAYSVGQVAGPFIGGQVGHFAGPRGPAYLAMWGSLLSAFTVFAFLKGNTRSSSEVEDDDAEKGKKAKAPSLADLISVCKVEGVPSLLCVKFFAGLSGEFFQTTLPLALKDDFQLSLTESGNVMSALGLLSMIVHGLLIKWLVKHFSDAKIVLGSCWILLLAFVGLALQHTFLQYLALLVPICAANYVFSTVNTAQLTKAVSSEQLGSVLAVDMALGSFTRMISPLFGTSLLQTHGIAGIGASSSSSVVIALLFMHFSVAKGSVAGLHKES